MIFGLMEEVVYKRIIAILYNISIRYKEDRIEKAYGQGLIYGKPSMMVTSNRHKPGSEHDPLAKQ